MLCLLINETGDKSSSSVRLIDPIFQYVNPLFLAQHTIFLDSHYFLIANCGVSPIPTGILSSSVFHFNYGT